MGETYSLNQQLAAMKMPLMLIETQIDASPRTSGHAMMHSHTFDELVVVLQGRGTHIVNDTESNISTGDVFFIQPGCLHSFSGLHHYRAVNIIFFRGKLNLPDDALRETSGYHALFELEPELRAGKGSAPTLTLDSRELALAQTFFNEIREEQTRKLPAWRYQASALFMELETLLVRCYEKINSRKSTALLQLSNMMLFLENHYHKKITLGEMAKTAGVSKRSLNRLCNEVLGISPKRHLLNFRLSKAKQILQKEKKAQISEVAFRVGFNDSNYFSKQYRKKYLRSPKDARQPEDNGPIIRRSWNAST